MRRRKEAVSDQRSAFSGMSREDDARFRAAVRKGVEQADRGEFIDEEEMDARVKRRLQP